MSRTTSRILLAARSSRRHRALETEQLPLPREPAAVAADLPARRDDPVARDDDRDRIAAERLPDGAAPARLPDPPRDLAVRDDLPRGHARRRHEDAALEGRHAAQVDPHVERPALAGKVRPQLVDDVGRLRGGADDGGAEPAEPADEGRLAPAEPDADDARVAGGDVQGADRRRHRAVVDDGPRRTGAVGVQRLERLQRGAVGRELAPSRVGGEPARELRRGGCVPEHERDQLLVARRHDDPPSAALSRLSAWYTLARAAASFPPSVAAISA